MTADLPAVRPATPLVRRNRTAWWVPWRTWLGGNLFFVALWVWGSVASGHLIFFWPLFMMLMSGVGVVGMWLSKRDGRREVQPPE